MPIAVSGGIGNASHALKAMLAGADVTMITSAIYREGPGIIEKMTNEIERFMEQRGWTTIADLHAARPLDFTTDENRLDYIRSLASRPRRSLQDETDHARAAVQLGDRWGHPKAKG
jgi:dihydroorotate dehydrogenase (fumarate)